MSTFGCLAANYAPRLVYGGIDLTSGDYEVEWGYDLGNGVTVYDDVMSLLRDGSLVSSTSTANRTLKIPVQIKATSGTLAIAVLATALAAEVNRPLNTFEAYPGDHDQPGGGPAMVIDTFVAQMDYDSDQAPHFERIGVRRYLLTIPALPGTRSVNQETVVWAAPYLTVAASLVGGTTYATVSYTGRNYLRVRSASQITAATVNGVAVDVNTIGVELGGTNRVSYIPTHSALGLPTVVTFTTAVAPTHVQAVNYPNKNHSTPGSGTVIALPLGIDIIDLLGTERAFGTIQFTAPAGGAFVYTAPDPDYRLRELGAGENVFSKFTAGAGGVTITLGASVMWYPQGTHAAQIGRSAAQPPQIFPNGVFPTMVTDTTPRYAYPQDPMAAVSFFETSGAKTLVSIQPTAEAGYSQDAVAHEDHQLHARRCGFAVMSAAAAPISTTILYYPRFKDWPDIP